MARKGHLVGVVGPVSLGGIRGAKPEALDPGTGTVVTPGSIALVSGDPAITFVALLNTDGAKPSGGGPRNDVVDRILRTSVPEYKGHDPIRMSIPVVLDGFRTGRSVEPDIALLHRLADKQPGGSRTPLIRVFGAVPFTERRWSIDGLIEWDDTPEPIRNAQGVLVRQALTVNLLERVADAFLQTSIARSRRSGSGARNGPHYTIVRAHEHNLGDVSKRLYGTRRRARELAQANNLAVGARLRHKQRIRVP